MLDLHCIRNIVLNVEMGKQEESQKTRAQPHQRTRRVEEGFRLGLRFSPLQSWMSSGPDELMFP